MDFSEFALKFSLKKITTTTPTTITASSQCFKHFIHRRLAAGRRNYTCAKMSAFYIYAISISIRHNEKPIDKCARINQNDDDDKQ